MTQDLHNRRDDHESREIQSDIDRTRADMDRTLDELGNRLRPSNLLDAAVGHFAGRRATGEGAVTRDDAAVTGAVTNAGRQLVDAIGDALRSAASSDAAHSLGATLKRHPLVTAGIGAGIAYLAMNGQNQPSVGTLRRRNREPQMYGGSYVDARTGEPYDVAAYEAEGRPYRQNDDRPGYADRAREGVGHAASSAGSAASSAAHRVGDAVSSAASAATSALSSAASAVGGALGHAREAAGDYAADAADRARGYVGDARSHAGDAYDSAGRSASGYYASGRSSLADGYDRARSAGREGYAVSRDRFDRALEDNPLAVGIAALAAGVLAGLAVPRTQQEDRYLGGYSRDLKNKATDAAGEAYERGRRVAEAGLHAAEEEAHRRGIGLDDLKRQGREIAREARDKAMHLVDEAKHEGRALADRAREQGKQVAGEARDAARQVADSTRNAVAGQEGVADDVGGRAKSLTEDAGVRAGHFRDDAADAAASLQRDVEDRHLTPSDLTEGAKAVAVAAKDAAAEEAEHQRDEAKADHNL